VKSSGAENFRLINHSRRSGNNAARNTGLKSATNDIVAFTDANAFLDKEALRYCAGHFSDRRVGCVAARYVKKIMIKSGESIGASFYHRIQGAKYKNEAEIGCAHTSQGYLQLFRKDLLDPGEKRISAVDMDMTLSVKEKGYEVVYEPRAIACKLPAATKEDLFIQMRRTLVGVIICIFKYRSLLNPFRHGFLSICFFSNRAIQLLTPFFIFLLVFSSYGIYILQPSRLFYYLIFLEMIAFFIGLTAVSLPQTKEITIQPFPVIKFFVLMNVFCLVAWRDFLKGDYNPIWTPIRTTRIRSQDLTNL
jgi:cellulose synthase/poly-beta-1,6-N-acetylglucosamine synthase-like glycosyltransferase